jgi:transposase
MKFKMQNKQNQLNERVARAVNFRGIVVGDPLTFENNEEGFTSLLHWITKLKRTNNLYAAIVGMEPTGHYWINLSKWLFEGTDPFR